MSKIPNGFEIIQLFESFSKKEYAMEGDKIGLQIGLQIGTLNKPIHGVMIALDVLEEVVDEAIEKKANLIIAHHPPIFRPLKHLATDQPGVRLIEKCIKHDIAVYAAHTNLDVASGGVNDLLALALQLTNTEVLEDTYQEELKKLVVFVPKDHSDNLKTVLGQSGAGHIGMYSHCSFSTSGTGSFLPLEGSNPYLGQAGKTEFVEEERIETIIPASQQRKIVSAMLKAHPYEEAAYDIYPVEAQGQALGLGRVGILEKEMTLHEFAEHVKKTLEVPFVRMTGDNNSKVKKVAVLGGDGNKYIHQAKRKGADVFVTGDLYYHVAHDAMMIGLNVIDPGHNVEKVMKKGVTDILLSMCEEKKFEVSIFPSEIHTDPFTIV
jgi:dinuclear metal center YbgI/SA1388 family protein